MTVVKSMSILAVQGLDSANHPVFWKQDVLEEA